ncbi:MAG TPA: ABC transporter ATP-binding protein [Stellaceae bacterium]|nr:ABC transporter ATP-binding protein [Stellaceae bacterium]
MSAEFAIRLAGVGKFYPMFTQPEDRLKQLLARGKRRYYQEYWALQDVTLDILKGESVGIIGRNGAGKSTFLQLVCGTLRPSTGSIQVEGRIAAMLELGAGFNPEFTGRENVHLAAAVLGLSAGLIKERYPSIVEFAGIGDFIDRPLKYYSSGMYARLAFAVAAHVDADILVVDEILSVGDAAFQQKCMRFIHAFRESGTLLLVSHSADTVAALCDRAVWLDIGTLRAAGRAKEVCHDYLAALSADRENVNAFRIGGSRKPPPSLPAPTLPATQRTFLPETLPRRPGMPLCTVRAVVLEDGLGHPATIAEGGKDAVLRIGVSAATAIDNPVVFFEVRDRLGQVLFCDDTRLRSRLEGLTFAADSWNEIAFHFEMPHLAPGEFAVSAGVATTVDGGWMVEDFCLDACFFRVTTSISHGLIGAWAQSIALSLRDPIPGSRDRVGVEE